MPREKSKWKPHEDQSTDARHRGGMVRSSDEGGVMQPEQRGHAICVSAERVNRASGRSP